MAIFPLPYTLPAAAAAPSAKRHSSDHQRLTVAANFDLCCRFTSQGKLVPDSVVLKLVAEAVDTNPDCASKGWLLDGFPRTAVQAEAMPSMVRLDTLCSPYAHHMLTLG